VHILLVKQVAARRRTDACEERSARSTSTLAPGPPAALIRATALTARDSLRATMTSLAPRAARASPAARPMPLVAPVTSTRFPLTPADSMTEERTGFCCGALLNDRSGVSYRNAVPAAPPTRSQAVANRCTRAQQRANRQEVGRRRSPTETSACSDMFSVPRLAHVAGSRISAVGPVCGVGCIAHVQSVERTTMNTSHNGVRGSARPQNGSLASTLLEARWAPYGQWAVDLVAYHRS
jgi:hypothetical protein